MIEQYEIELPPFSRGYHLVTSHIVKKIGELPEKGILHLFIKHTSAGLTLNENADPSVRRDFETFLNHLIPDNSSIMSHKLEGADDMPAHLKSSIIGQSVTIPITDHQLNLGIWQGIYLCEFRNYGGSRSLIATIYH